jgi:trimethylamine---corrinoid protein Co-methyltransferase
MYIFKWADKKEIINIHNKSLNIIEEVGFKLDDKDLLKRLKQFDTRVDLIKKNIKIPKKVAEYFLKKIPKEIVLYGIDPKYDIKLGSKRLYRPISGTINICDDYCNIRKPLEKDVIKVARIVENLELIHFNATSMLPFDAPLSIIDVAAAKINFENCSKHILVDTLNEKSFLAILEMAFKISGDEKLFKARPFFQVHFPATSPLIFDKNACANLRLATKYNIPVRAGSSPMSGANSPIKLAGTILLMHAEILSGMIISQMLNEGNPVFYGAVPAIFDMRFGTMSWGSPEHAKMAALSSELAQYCGVYSTTTGFATDSKAPNDQAIMEKTMNALLAALSGVNIIAGAGLLEGELTYSIAQLIVDNEIAKYIENILRGVDIKEENLSLELIKSVGIGGSYINTDQTLEFYKTEHEQFGLLDRRPRNAWINTPDKDMYSKAKNIISEIQSASNKKSILPDKVLGELEEIYLKCLK